MIEKSCNVIGQEFILVSWLKFYVSSQVKDTFVLLKIG